MRFANTTQNGGYPGIISGPFTTCKVIAGYQPAPGWDLQNFTVPFSWNGNGNICLELCWQPHTGANRNSQALGRVFMYPKNPAWGDVRDKRYHRLDTDLCGTTYKPWYNSYGSPQVQMQFGPTGPQPNCAPDVIAGPANLQWISNECKTMSASGGTGQITWESDDNPAFTSPTAIAGGYTATVQMILRSTTDQNLYIRVKRYTKPGPSGTCYSNTINVVLDCASSITVAADAAAHITNVSINGPGLSWSNSSTYPSCGAVTGF